jgi:hypothetical protein
MLKKKRVINSFVVHQIVPNTNYTIELKLIFEATNYLEAIVRFSVQIKCTCK